MPEKSRLSHLHPVVRGVRLHGRLVIAVMAALVVFVLTPVLAAPSTRLLMAWNAGVAVYLALTVVLIVRSDVGRLRRRAAEDDEGAVFIMALAALAALASLGAIFLEFSLAKAKPAEIVLHLSLGVATIALSWIFVHTIFAQHYAHEFYQDGDKPGGLKFPGERAPDYWDFLYFSLVIGMTSQVSDVAVTDRAMRIAVMAHGVLSFVFNTTIIALTVNIAASVL